VSISDILSLAGQYGWRVAAVRADRLEAEVKSLNVTLQQYLAMGFAIKQTMQAAATEINK
jgi:hypothetical protein